MDGVLVKRLVSEGDVVLVGQPIAEFAVEGEAATVEMPHQRLQLLLKQLPATGAASNASGPAPAEDVVAALEAPLAWPPMGWPR